MQNCDITCVFDMSFLSSSQKPLTRCVAIVAAAFSARARREVFEAILSAVRNDARNHQSVAASICPGCPARRAIRC